MIKIPICSISSLQLDSPKSGPPRISRLGSEEAIRLLLDGATAAPLLRRHARDTGQDALALLDPAEEAGPKVGVLDHFTARPACGEQSAEIRSLQFQGIGHFDCCLLLLR